MNKNKKILVTGATGLLGNYIIRYLLLHGFTNVIGCRRDTSSLLQVSDVQNRIDWKIMDLRDVTEVYDAMDGVKVVIHAAAHVSWSGNAMSEMYSTNVEGTRNIVNAALECGVDQFVFISSIAALGRATLNNHMDESTDWVDSEYNTSYAISKYQSELEVWRGNAEGLPIIILSPGYIIGSGSWGRSSLQIFDQIASGLKYFPPGTNGFVDVRDVARACHKVIDKKVIGKKILIVSENWSYQKWLSVMAGYMDVVPPSQPIPYKLAMIWTKILYWWSKISGRPARITSEALRSLITDNYYDNTKSIELLGFQYIPIDKSIEEAVSKFRNGTSTPLPFPESNVQL